MLQAFFEFYLSSGHRDQVEEGCPVAALSRDISMSSAQFRKEFSKLLSSTVENRRNLLSSKSRAISRKEWIQAMAAYVGALILSRATAGSEFSMEILDGARELLTQMNAEERKPI